jgi:hypothetical protein
MKDHTVRSLTRSTLQLIVIILVLILQIRTSAAAQSDKTSTDDKGRDAFSTDWGRLTVGVEQAGSASANRQSAFLIDFMLNAPISSLALPQDPHRSKLPYIMGVANFRLTSAPQQTVSSVKQLAGGYQDTVISGSTATLQNLDVLAGVEIRLGTNGFPYDRDRYALQPLLLIVGGFSTPPNPNQPPTFELTPEARRRLNVPADTDTQKYKYIAFVQPDRSAFFPQFYWGIRLKTHHYASPRSEDRVRFPGIIDITLGQNAAINGGNGSLTHDLTDILRLEAFYPLPFKDPKTSVYLFGAAYKHLRGQSDREVEQEPLLLKGATVQPPNPEVFVHVLQPDERRRDFWKFGVGIDLVNLFSSKK